MSCESVFPICITVPSFERETKHIIIHHHYLLVSKILYFPSQISGVSRYGDTSWRSKSFSYGNEQAGWMKLCSQRWKLATKFSSELFVGYKRRSTCGSCDVSLQNMIWIWLDLVGFGYMKATSCRWIMTSNLCSVVCRPRITKFQCCLWAARVGAGGTHRKFFRASCNIEIWSLGFYLVGVCRV